MSNGEIETNSVGPGVAQSTPVPLDSTPETKIQFHPTLQRKSIQYIYAII